MPCKGNDKENCGGNSTNMVYFFGLGKFLWHQKKTAAWLVNRNQAYRDTSRELYQEVIPSLKMVMPHASIKHTVFAIFVFWASDNVRVIFWVISTSSFHSSMLQKKFIFWNFLRLAFLLACRVTWAILSSGTNYTITTSTGDIDGADTDAKVYITLYGEKGDSGFRKLDTKHFTRGK